MREIKFRAWTGEIMINNPYHFDLNFQSDSKMFWRCYDTRNDLENNISYPCEILEFTGIKDKYGKEIYEGDILAICNGSINGFPWMERIRVVQFRWGSFNIPIWDYDSTHWIAVIGNIYKNPELL